MRGGLGNYMDGLPSKFAIYYDALQEGKWFQSLDSHLASARLLKMLNKGQNPPNIDDLLKYDRPDIILTYGSRPSLVLERTEEVPTGHNVGQRFARIVRAAEVRVPAVYFFPFVAQKHGKESQDREAEQKTNQRYVNARLFEALERLEEIHKSLVIPINWPVDKGYELLRTSQKDQEVQRIVSLVVDATLSNLPLEQLRANPFIAEIKEKARRERDQRLASQSRYSEPPPSVKIIDTDSLIKACSMHKTVAARLSSRKNSLVYEIGMNYIRSDPYTGMLLFYDYLLTRTGPHSSQRSMNLVAKMPNISLDDWKRKCASKSARKDIFLFSNFSDAILLAGDMAV